MPQLSADNRSNAATNINIRAFFQASRFRLIMHFLLLFSIFAFASRLALTIVSWAQIDHTAGQLAAIFAIGLYYDLVCALYCAVPITLYLIFIPANIFTSKWHRNILHLLLFAIIYILGFSTLAEWFFWDEFGVRFNFIAVDYLIYTTEVIGNIRESYPIPLLLSLIFIGSLALYYLSRRIFTSTLISEWQKAPSNLRQRFKEGGVFLLLPILSFFFVSATTTDIFSNRFDKELASNGVYQLFAAFNNNTLDYKTFYQNMGEEEVFTELRQQLQTEQTVFKNTQPVDITRTISHSGPEKKPNVVLVMMESMSAEYLGAFNSHRGWTPNLDRLAREGMLFTNLYATGTRTVRGMEAVTLSTPPTPGRSTVKRPNNSGMFSMGFVFQEKGYDRTFFYGGYGYFDNMNSFFSGNGFNIVDRASLQPQEITFANIWGVCDEDMYRRAIKDFDNSYRQGNPFFGYLMTTSNHRPYTYPEGKIDIPSHTGRSGGVKYSDYAIGEFMQEASLHPWFNNTIFVFVADHCAGSSGRQELPLYRYRIPLIIYGPQLIIPTINNTIASQIDVAPTLFGMLNWNYQSKFMGKNILSDDFTPRAFVGNYQKLGYVKNNVLTILTERGAADQYRISAETLQDEKLKKVTDEEQLTKEAIAYYQGASLLNDKKLNRWK